MYIIIIYICVNMIIHINNVCMLLIWNILACKIKRNIYLHRWVVLKYIGGLLLLYIYYMIIIIPYQIKYC